MAGAGTGERQLGGAWIACLLALVSAALVGHALLYGFFSDDAYILARYARNAARGHGFVFNVGDPVEGYTSFAWTAIAAFLGALDVDCARAARAMSLAGALGCVWLAYLAAPRFGIERRSPLALLAPAGLAASAPMACWALGGLETPGYALAILGAVFVFASERRTLRTHAAAGALAGLCALARPEGVLVGLVFVAWTALDRRELRRGRALLALALPFAALVLTHLFWRRWFYGDWLPNTFHAKVGTRVDQVQRGLVYVLDGVEANGGLLAWLPPLLAPWALAAPRGARLASAVALMLMAGVVLVGGDGLPMVRFLLPVFPLWLALVAFTLRALLAAASRARDAAGPRARLARAAAGLAALALGASLALHPTSDAGFANYREHHADLPKWRAAGEWLAANAPPGASLACVPVGAVAYYSDLVVHDMLGLTDRHIGRKAMPIGGGWAGHEKHDGPYIVSLAPTYLLLGNVQVLDAPLPLESPFFCRPPAKAVQERERDVWSDVMRREYRPRVARLADGTYLHFMVRKDAAPR